MGFKSTKEQKLKYTQEEYEDYILSNFNFEVLSEYKGSMYPTKVRHKVCGGISDRTTDQIKRRGCPYCNGSMLLRGFNDLSITAPDVYELLTDKEDCMYYPHSSKETSFTCPTCGNKMIKRIVSVTNYGLNCPTCDDGFSYPEKFVMSMLSQCNIVFEGQKKFDFLKGKKYDFYIKSKNLIIETHGGQHYTDTFRFKSKVRNEKENDELKRTTAIKNGIENYFEIDCRYSNGDYIKESIINSGVLDVLEINAEDIDFNKCEIDANNSLVKQAWELWNTGKYSNNEIAKKLNLSPNTTCHYLGLGTKLGVCNYDGQEERNKASAHAVVLTNTGEVFDYIEEAQRKYNIKNIAGCCAGRIRSAGQDKDGNPLVWVYLEDYDKNKDYTYDNDTIKKIICLETQVIYNKIIDACKYYDISDTSISCNLTRRLSFAGRDKNTKMPLHWMYYDEYLNASDEDIQSIIDSTPLRYSSIICMNDLEIFESATAALEHGGLKNVSGITDCCKGKIKYAGNVNGERARWMYYKDYMEKYGEVVKTA